MKRQRARRKRFRIARREWLWMLVPVVLAGAIGCGAKPGGASARKSPAPVVSARSRALLMPSGSAKPAQYHVVGKGETLYAIARRYAVAADALVAANHLGDGNRIATGQHLLVPTASVAERPHILEHRRTATP